MILVRSDISFVELPAEEFGAIEVRPLLYGCPIMIYRCDEEIGAIKLTRAYIPPGAVTTLEQVRRLTQPFGMMRHRGPTAGQLVAGRLDHVGGEKSFGCWLSQHGLQMWSGLNRGKQRSGNALGESLFCRGRDTAGIFAGGLGNGRNGWTRR